MKTKDYIKPHCECVQMWTEGSFLLVASAGGEGEAGAIIGPNDEFIYDL